MEKIMIFEKEEFGSVRTVKVKDKYYFCGKDVAKALGYKDTKKAIAEHCPHALKRPLGVVTGKKADGTDAVQTVSFSFIPEGDIYRLIMSSKLESAQKFESWVFDEVLPTLRKKGSYKTPEKKFEEASKKQRIDFTDMLKEHGYSKPNEYIQTTMQMRHVLNIPDGLKKENFDRKQRAAVMAAEALSVLQVTDEYGYYQVNPVCKNSANQVMELTESKRASIGA